MSRPIVIGVGNALRGDDAAGLQVARQLTDRGWEGVHETSGETATLMALWQDARCVLLADAAQSGAGAGTVMRLDVSSQPLPAAFLHCSTHAFGVAEAVELARALGSLPSRIVVYGIEGASFEHGAPLSPEVEAGIIRVVGMIEDELKS